MKHIISLPCKVGDIVFVPWVMKDENDHGIEETHLVGFVDEREFGGNFYYLTHNGGCSADVAKDLLFTTIEAAEAKLIKMLKKESVSPSEDVG